MESCSDSSCPNCDHGWGLGHGPDLVKVDIPRQLTWYECRQCGSLWVETERYLRKVDRSAIAVETEMRLVDGDAVP